MRILVLGGGGREHALCWKLQQSPAVEALFALPGSDAIAALATCLSGDPSDAAAVVEAAARSRVDLTVVGPEAPLAAGVTDALRSAGHAVFGPTRAAAQLETSKIFAKEFLSRHSIPTARFQACTTAAEARRAAAALGSPIVIKADGLAAGKGVVIAANAAEADAAIEAMLAGELAGLAGQRLVIEECLRGPELSVLALADGERWTLLPAARDHKRLLDGDLGPNTGGMGAVSTDALLPRELARVLEAEVIAPTLRGMAASGHLFQGVLYCGLMLTAQGPKVLEFNVRFGDPEAQTILPRWGGDLAATLAAAARGALGDQRPAALAPASVCVVAAAGSYPAAPSRGEPVRLPERLDPGCTIFHAGTRKEKGAWQTAGGRVLGVTSCAADVARARQACYATLECISFPGMRFRRDIGLTAIQP
ncbi:MAG TPA: phosphoribosylamine--glycine ligase [Terriglobales bacterium]|nr:phosphoribosylamine--glycine ligase [Terriglobales bacterium]